MESSTFQIKETGELWALKKFIGVSLISTTSVHNKYLTTTSLNNLAGLYRAQGQYAQAELLYQRALSIHEKALGPAHPNSVTIRENYTDLLEKMKQAGITLSTPE